MSGCREESGPSVAAKPDQLSSDRIAKELDNEHTKLVQLRSLVQQQLRVLQVSRLIRAPK